MIVDAVVFVVLGMIVGFCMADALHRFARRLPRDVALSVTGEHPYGHDVEGAPLSVMAAEARASIGDPTERQRVGIDPWPRTDGSEMDAYLDRQRGNPRMMGN